MKIKKSFVFLLVLLLSICFTSLIYSQEKEKPENVITDWNKVGFRTLIDFSQYNQMLSNEVYSDDDPIRQKAFDSPEILKDFQLRNVFNVYVPEMKITKEDMKIENWICELKVSKNKGMFEYFNPKNTFLNDVGLVLKINFPSIFTPVKCIIRPPFEILHVNTKGQLIKDGQGVIANTGEIHAIAISYKVVGNFRNNLIAVRLKDHQDNVYEFPLDFTENNFPEIEYAFDSHGFIFNNVFIKNKDENKTEDKDNLNKVLWVNPKYLPLSRTDIRNVKFKPTYPAEVPYYKFDSVVVYRGNENSGNRFIIYIKDIKVLCDKGIPFLEQTSEKDDSYWGIMNSFYLNQRRKIESYAIWSMYQVFQKAKRDGITSYKEFLANTFRTSEKKSDTTPATDSEISKDNIVFPIRKAYHLCQPYFDSSR